MGMRRFTRPTDAFAKTARSPAATASPRFMHRTGAGPLQDHGQPSSLTPATERECPIKCGLARRW
jgi:hypothetical protein